MVIPRPSGAASSSPRPDRSRAGGLAGRRADHRRGARPPPTRPTALSAMTAPSALWAGGTTLAAPVLRASLRWRAHRGKEWPAPGRAAGRRRHAAAGGHASLGPRRERRRKRFGPPVIAAIGSRAPASRFLLTTGTVTSASLMTERLGELGLTRVLHRFAPLDVPRWASRFLDHWRRTRRRSSRASCGRTCSAAVARGACRDTRERATIGAQLRPLAAGSEARVAGHALPRSGAGANGRRRGAAARAWAALRGLRARVTSNSPPRPLPVDAAELARLRTALAGRPLLGGRQHASGRGGDRDRRASASWRRPWPGLLTILVAAPSGARGGVGGACRGATRTDRAARRLRPRGLWIADTLGELGLLVSPAGIAALVGRSLLPPGGGQNPLEPARLGCAVWSPDRSCDNFADHGAVRWTAAGA